MPSSRRPRRRHPAAQRERLDEFEPSPKGVACCAIACDNVRALATMERKERALARFTLSR